MNCPIEKQLNLMGADAQFSDDGLLSLTFSANDDKEFVVVLHKDMTEMKLRICIESYFHIPEKSISKDVFVQFAQQALEPLRDGCGIGLYPGTDNVSAWKVIDLNKPIELQLIFDELVSCLHKWDAIFINELDNQKGNTNTTTETKVFRNLL